MKKVVKSISVERVRLRKKYTISSVLKQHHIDHIFRQLPVHNTVDKEQVLKKIDAACSYYCDDKEGLKHKHKRILLGQYQKLERALCDAKNVLNDFTSQEAIFLQRAEYLLTKTLSKEPFAIIDNLERFKKEINLYCQYARDAGGLVKLYGGRKKSKSVLESILIYRLAEIYEEATQRKFNRSTNTGSALDFVSAVFRAIDPKTRGIDKAMRQVIADRRKQ